MNSGESGWSALRYYCPAVVCRSCSCCPRLQRISKRGARPAAWLPQHRGETRNWGHLHGKMGLPPFSQLLHCQGAVPPDRQPQAAGVLESGVLLGHNYLLPSLFPFSPSSFFTVVFPPHFFFFFFISFFLLCTQIMNGSFLPYMVLCYLSKDRMKECLSNVLFIIQTIN